MAACEGCSGGCSCKSYREQGLPGSAYSGKLGTVASPQRVSGFLPVTAAALPPYPLSRPCSVLQDVDLPEVPQGQAEQQQAQPADEFGLPAIPQRT